MLCTCTIEFSGIGVMVLKVFLICSRQRGTYFSNNMVRWALSVWRSRWSIQLATYLSNNPRHYFKLLCRSDQDLNECPLSFEYNTFLHISTANNVMEAPYRVLHNIVTFVQQSDITHNTEDNTKTELH